MYRYLLTEVVRQGKQEEDQAYRAKAAPILQRYGATLKVWAVQGRTANQVLVDWGTFESTEEADELLTKLHADEEWMALEEERNRAGTIVPGSMEVWILRD